jgi:hypothetical protein
MTTRTQRGGIQPRGRDRHGVEVWQLRGQVDGISRRSAGTAS